jgi:predicted outer membrane repeat protein
MATKYVSTSIKANDGNSGDDPVNQPWRTIQHGVDWFRDNKQPADAGDLRLVNGSYEEHVSMEGVKYSNITIQADKLGAFKADIIQDYCEARPQIGGDPQPQGKRLDKNVFTIRDAVGVVLKDLTILKGHCGVNAKKADKLLLDNCCIHDNVSPDHGAGFLFAECNDSKVNQCRVWSNEANKQAGGGGHIEKSERVTITESLFYLNRAATHGGALYVDNCKAVEVNKCVVGAQDNAAKHLGPNTANENGGGIHISDSQGVKLTGDKNQKNVIAYNQAEKNGGGISITGGRPAWNVSILENNDIHHNTAKDNGGGIYAVALISGPLLIEKSDIHDNTATTDRGGGVAARLDVICTVKESKLYGNQAEKEKGGGISAVVAALVLQDDCELYGNQAKHGGAISVEEANLTIRKAKIHDNKASIHGGGIRVQHLDLKNPNKTVDISEVAFINNIAGQDGGGLDYNCPFVPKKLVIADSAFEKNQATEGGGLSVYAKDSLELTNTRFKGNVATGKGGGVSVDSAGSKKIESNNILENTAASGAGFFFHVCKVDGLHVTKNEFKDNKLVQPAVPPGGAPPKRGTGRDVLCDTCTGADKNSLETDNTPAKSGVVPDVVVQ